MHNIPRIWTYLRPWCRLSGAIEGAHCACIRPVGSLCVFFLRHAPAGKIRVLRCICSPTYSEQTRLGPSWRLASQTKAIIATRALVLWTALVVHLELPPEAAWLRRRRPYSRPFCLWCRSSWGHHWAASKCFRRRTSSPEIQSFLKNYLIFYYSFLDYLMLICLSTSYILLSCPITSYLIIYFYIWFLLFLYYPYGFWCVWILSVSMQVCWSFCELRWVWYLWISCILGCD